MNKNGKISDLIRQNHNSRKLTSDAVEALTGKRLEWYIEKLGERGDGCAETETDRAAEAREASSGNPGESQR